VAAVVGAVMGILIVFVEHTFNLDIHPVISSFIVGLSAIIVVSIVNAKIFRKR
jgi:hypothetical protein